MPLRFVPSPGWQFSSADLSTSRRGDPVRPLVLLADDHTSVATAVSRYLGDRFDVLAPITDLDLLGRVAPLVQNLVLVSDLGFGSRSAIGVWDRLSGQRSGCLVIAYTAHEGEVIRRLARAAGAWRFVSKVETLELLGEVVAAACAELQPGAGTSRPASPAASQSRPAGHVHGELVRWALVSGFRKRAIARVTGLAPQTVAYHAGQLSPSGA